MSDEKELSLEEHLDHLSQTIDQMEDDEISLDASFALYKQGIAEIKEANDMLDAMEKEMLLLADDGSLEEF